VTLSEQLVSQEKAKHAAHSLGGNFSAQRRKADFSRKNGLVETKDSSPMLLSFRCSFTYFLFVFFQKHATF
jgi:hypothetical protein